MNKKPTHKLILTASHLPKLPAPSGDAAFQKRLLEIFPPDSAFSSGPPSDPEKYLHRVWCPRCALKGKRTLTGLSSIEGTTILCSDCDWDLKVEIAAMPDLTVEGMGVWDKLASSVPLWPFVLAALVACFAAYCLLPTAYSFGA